MITSFELKVNGNRLVPSIDLVVFFLYEEGKILIVVL